jgi:hypothetical protein
MEVGMAILKRNMLLLTLENIYGIRYINFIEVCFFSIDDLAVPLLNLYPGKYFHRSENNHKRGCSHELVCGKSELGTGK